MHHVIEYDIQCKSCDGTGLYVGMAERDGAAVVCHTCEGSGCQHVKFEYNDFDGRKDRRGITRVFEANPGIMIGEGGGYKLTDFGGMPYAEWAAGVPFPAGSENRSGTCPCWWYQSADCKKKPKWKECNSSIGSSFSRCPHFVIKSGCWARWDKENGQ